jgi:hypothetical protein
VKAASAACPVTTGCMERSCWTWVALDLLTFKKKYIIVFFQLINREEK